MEKNPFLEVNKTQQSLPVTNKKTSNPFLDIQSNKPSLPALPEKKTSILSKVKNKAKEVALNTVQNINPAIGLALKTDTGQNIAKGVAKYGAESLKATEKPFLQPFAMVSNKDIPETPISPAVSANPTPGEALGEGISAGLTAFGMKGLPTAVSKITSSIANKAKEKVSKAIIEKIMPKLTKTEQSLAVQEGRVTAGAESKLFGKKPDIVAPTPKIENASKLIQEKIPNAEKLSNYELHGAVKNETTNIAKSLKPEMEKIIVPKEKTDAIKSTWETVKKTQQKTSDYDLYNGKKIQKNFEAVLDDLKLPVKDPVTKQFRQKNLDEVWEARKNYDASIPERVKQADINSPSDLQYQREVWLENRKILNDIINDTQEGLGELSKKSFKNMSDLYEAAENILSNVKIDTKGTKGLVQEILPGKVADWAKGAAITGLGIGAYNKFR